MPAVESVHPPLVVRVWLYHEGLLLEETPLMIVANIGRSSCNRQMSKSGRYADGWRQSCLPYRSRTLESLETDSSPSVHAIQPGRVQALTVSEVEPISQDEQRTACRFK